MRRRFKQTKKQKQRKFYKFHRCSDTGKQIYPTMDEAQRAITVMWGSLPISMEEYKDLHAYECEACGNFHVGHRSYYQKLGVDQ